MPLIDKVGVYNVASLRQALGSFRKEPHRQTAISEKNRRDKRDEKKFTLELSG